MSTDGRHVTLQEAVVYASPSARDLRCDLFLPPETEAPRPCIILIHGGAWRLGNKSQLRGYGFLFGREGYVCVAIEYRLTGEAKWPAQREDVEAALAWVRANAKEYNIDERRITLLGHSSGGQMALIAAGRSLKSPDLPRVAAVISFYAPAELTPKGDMLRESVDLLLGPEAPAAAYMDASPVSQVKHDFPPVLILHSNADQIVPRRQGLMLYEGLLKEGAPVELHMFDRVDHAFDQDKGLARLSVAIALDFLRRHVDAASG